MLCEIGFFFNRVCRKIKIYGQYRTSEIIKRTRYNGNAEQMAFLVHGHSGASEITFLRNREN